MMAKTIKATIKRVPLKRRHPDFGSAHVVRITTNDREGKTMFYVIPSRAKKLLLVTKKNSRALFLKVTFRGEKIEISEGFPSIVFEREALATLYARN